MDFTLDAERVFSAKVNKTDSFGGCVLDELPIGMAYVPYQKWRNVYNADVALERGTIFAELDMPFLGRRTDK